MKASYCFTVAGTLVSVMLNASPAMAQVQLTEHTLRLDADTESAPAKLSDLKWLVGYWRGSGLGAEADENWAPAAGGNMAGTMRLFKNGKLSFSEYMLIEPLGDSLTLRLKHFNSDFSGWEEKDKFVEFRLIKIEGQTTWFDGLTYRLHGDELHAIVAMKQRDGGYREGVFEYRRQNPTSGDQN